MSTTTTPVERLINTLTESLQNLPFKILDIFENILFSIITENELTIILFILIVLFLGFVDAIITGNWGNLGRILYRVVYSGFAIVIILIWGIEVIFSDFYSIASVLIFSPLSFRIVGYILKKLGFKQ